MRIPINVAEGLDCTLISSDDKLRTRVEFTSAVCNPIFKLLNLGGKKMFHSTKDTMLCGVAVCDAQAFAKQASKGSSVHTVLTFTNTCTTLTQNFVIFDLE